MGFKIFLAVMFLLGIGAEANPMERCMEGMEEQFDSVIELASEEQLNTFCGTVSGLLECMNDVMRDETGFTLRELAELLEGTEIAKALGILVNIEELVEDICTEGSELHNDYLANAECYHNAPTDLKEDCDQQAKVAYSTFRELQVETGRGQTSADEPCVVAAYQLGCVGADVHERCGDEGFETYKKIVKKIGIFKSGLCSSELMNTLKTDWIDSLEMSEGQKILYRVILDLKRRRR